MKKTLIQILKNTPVRKGLIMYRSSKEREYLEGWLKRKVDRNDTSGSPQLRASSASPVRRETEFCTGCPGSREMKRARGSGENGVMVILNAPAMMTLFEKNELKNESVGMIKKIIESIGLELSRCYITNMIKCDAEGSMKPSSLFASCSNLLIQEIEQVQPHVVLVMGDLTPMRRIRKKFPDSNWYEIPHPVTMLKNPDLKVNAWRTLKNIMSLLNSEG